MRIYLDVCCLCRPFDDLQNKKIRLEADAVLSILDRCSRDWELVASVAVSDEISFIPDVEKRLKVEQKLALVTDYIPLDEEIFNQVLIFQKAGIRLYDSIHLACAERRKAILLTTDNRIIKIANTFPGITIPVKNPVNWLMEVSTDENNQ